MTAGLALALLGAYFAGVVGQILFEEAGFVWPHRLWFGATVAVLTTLVLKGLGL